MKIRSSEGEPLSQLAQVLARNLFCAKARGRGKRGGCNCVSSIEDSGALFIVDN